MQLLESELTPDCVLPVQLYDRSFEGARLQPEKRLQLAVLADAVLTYRRWVGDEPARARHVFVEVETWFASDDADGPFTFITICDSLKLDPDYIRRGLRQWRAHLEATAKHGKSLRRDANETRDQVVLPRLRRVA
jgi:hypothetical protein